jgi:serine/threonine-protein kinase
MNIDNIDSTAELLKVLEDKKFLNAAQLDTLMRELAETPADLPALTRNLIQREWLTGYQVNHILNGKADELILGSYILLERIGEGGLGQIFKARHQRLGRLVALKVIRQDHLDNDLAVRRFRREIKAVAQLAHPNIVLAFDTDEVNGTHFYVMEYVEGTNLADMVQKSGPLPIGEACEYLRQTAMGLQHAFEKGLIHRNIKPENLLVTGVRSLGMGLRGGEQTSTGLSRPAAVATPLVKILDMGLARIAKPMEVRTTSLGSITLEGKVVGTPDYLAPEQARNSPVIDIRADLYSLGCTAYFILTGQKVFPGGTVLERMFKHQLEEPIRVEKLRPEVPPALSAIVHRLLAKRPEDRFQSPIELAQALEPFCGERFAALAKEAAAAALSGPNTHPHPPSDASINTQSAASAPTSRQRPSEPKPKLSPTPLTTRPGAAALHRRTTERVARKPAAPSVTPKPSPSAADADERVNEETPAGATPKETPAKPALVSRPVRPRDAKTVSRFVPPTRSLAVRDRDKRRYWLLGGIALAGFIGGMAFFGILVPSSGNRSLFNIFPKDTSSNTAVADAPPVPEAERVAGQPKELKAVFGEHRGHNWTPFRNIALSTNGKSIITIGTDNVVRVWDASSLREQAMFKGPRSTMTPSLSAIAPDGQTIAFVSSDAPGGKGRVTVWDVATAKERHSLPLPSSADLVSLRFTPDKQTLLGGSRNGEVKAWDLTTGHEKHAFRLPGAGPVVAIASNGLWAVSLPPAAEAGKGPYQVRVLDVRSDKERAIFKGHKAPVQVAVFSPDGRRVATAASTSANSAEIKVWDSDTGAELAAWKGPLPAIRALKFAPDGQALAVTAQDGSVQLWDPANGREQFIRSGSGTGAPVVAFAADSKSLVAGGQDHALWLWDTIAARELISSSRQLPVRSLMFTPDSKGLLAILQERVGDRLIGSIRLWDLFSAKERRLPREPKDSVQAVAFAPDGKNLFLGSTESDGTRVSGTAQLWEMQTGNEWFVHKITDAGVLAVTYEPNGQSVAAGLGDGIVKIWDAPSGRERASFRPFASGTAIQQLAFSSSGNTIIVVGAERGSGVTTGIVKVWDLASNKEIHSYRDPKGPLSSIAIAPDGQSVIVASPDPWENGMQVARIIDLATGRERLRLPEAAGIFTAFAYSPDGEVLATANMDGHVVLWEARTTKKMQELDFPGPIQQLALSKDSKYLATGNGNGTVYLLKLSGQKQPLVNK